MHIIRSVTTLAFVTMTITGTATSCHQTPIPTQTMVTKTTTPMSTIDKWVVTDSYYDPEFGRRTIICVNSAGNLRIATAWKELDIPGSPLDRPCPAGRVLDEGVIGN